MRIDFDLHVHSEFSNDGELGIKEIVQKCLSNHIKILSVTDHNCIKETEKALSICRNSGIEFIPGIEIDCNYMGIDLHLLGYHIDWRSSDFTELEARIERMAWEVVPRMINSLASAGIQIDADELMEKSGGKLPAPEMFAEVLISNKDYHTNLKLAPYLKGGEKSDMPYINFYLDYFAQGKPAYVKMDHMKFSEAVNLIENNGGIPIVSHPGLNFKGKEEMALELFDHGAKGLEVFNNYHDHHQMEYFASAVLEKGALMTGGSDFHGKIKPLIDLGEYPLIDTYRVHLNRSIEIIQQYDSHS